RAGRATTSRGRPRRRRRTRRAAGRRRRRDVRLEGAAAGSRPPCARPRGGCLMPDMTPGVPSALSPLIRRVVANNPGLMTGPGTNTYLVGIDEVAVIDPGPADDRHVEAIVGASMRERVRWVLRT